MVKLLHPLFIVLLISSVSWSQSFEKDSLSIVSILHAQEKAWNSFDIDAFMDGYWRSPDLVFCGAKGPVYGWEATRDRYKKTYDSQQKMGRLQFTILNMQAFQTDVMQLIGRFELIRNQKNASGYFTLLWKRFEGQWKIVSDHTSASQ